MSELPVFDELGAELEQTVSPIVEKVPAISFIAPEEALAGEEVHIAGINFTGATDVKFGGVSATIFTVEDDTLIKATVPAGLTDIKRYDIEVITPDGKSLPNPEARMASGAGPTVTSVTPNQGPRKGGQDVTISGSNFTLVTDVRFGSKSVLFDDIAVSWTRIDANTIRVTTPAQTVEGLVNVTVKTVGGSDTLANGYQYFDEPHISFVNPSVGGFGGGNRVRVVGRDLAEVTKVEFGARRASIVQVTDTFIDVDTPSQPPQGTPLTVNVVATSPFGVSRTHSGTDFTYIPEPSITSLSPPRGPLVGGTKVTITGDNLRYMRSIRFTGPKGTSGAFRIDVLSNTKVVVTTDKHFTGVWGPNQDVKVRVTSAGGVSNALDFTFWTWLHLEILMARKLNQLRRSKGLPTLRHTDRLHGCARRQALEMLKTGKFEHWLVDKGCGDSENILRTGNNANRHPSVIADAFADAYMKSSGHRRNRLRAFWVNQGQGVAGRLVSFDTGSITFRHCERFED